MPRRRNKTEDKSDPRFFTKKGERRSHVMDRIESQERGKERLKGTAVTKPWRRSKNNQIVDMELVPPPFLRSDIRDQNFGDGSRRSRRSPDGTTDRPFTKPSVGTVRKRRRMHNAIAKASRRVNR
jgi:hypothetical protein